MRLLFSGEALGLSRDLWDLPSRQIETPTRLQLSALLFRRGRLAGWTTLPPPPPRRHSQRFQEKDREEEKDRGEKQGWGRPW